MMGEVHDFYTDAVDFSWSSGYTFNRSFTLLGDTSIANSAVGYFDIEHLERDYPRARCSINPSEDLFEGCEITVKGNLRYNGSTQSSAIIFEGVAEREANKYPPQYKLVNKGREIDTIKPVGAYSGTRNAIIKSIISGNNQYIQCTTTTMSTGGSSVVQFYGDKSERAIFNDFGRQDGFLWGLSPTGWMHYGTFALSNDVDSLSASCGKIFDVNVEPSKIEYNKIRVLGGFNSSSVQVSSTVQDSSSIDLIGENPFLEVDATLTTTTACSERALAILTKNQYGPKEITYRYKDKDSPKGFVPPLQSITFGYDTNQFDLVPEESYVIRGNKYDVKNDLNHLKTTSGIYYSSKTTEALVSENTTMINQVNSNVATNASNISTHTSQLSAENYVQWDDDDPAANDFDHTDLTVNSAWHELDLDGFKTVPSGTIGCWVKAQIKDGSLGMVLRIRSTSQANVYQTSELRTIVANQYHVGTLFIPLDGDNKFDYYVSNGMDEVYVVVLAWVREH